MRLRLISGLVCVVLGILATVLLIGLATDAGSSTGSDRVFVGALAGIFLLTGVALVIVDFRSRGRPPGFFATVAGVIAGVIGVIAAAGVLAAYDVQLDGGKSSRAVVIAVVAVAGVLPGMGVHRLLRRKNATNEGASHVPHR